MRRRISHGIALIPRIPNYQGDCETTTVVWSAHISCFLEVAWTERLTCGMFYQAR
jgi:hypothetical protein